MTALGGGGIAAFGFHYQYLVTIEWFLAFLRENPEAIPRATLVVEPLHTKPDGADEDVVDFAIEIDGEVEHNSQVKSSSEPETHPLQPKQARDPLQRLVAYPAARMLLLTNKPISPDLLQEVEVESGGTEDRRTTYTWPNGPQRPGASEQPRIIVDSRRPADLRNSIAELARNFRKDRGLKQGLVSSQLMVSILLDHVFAAASGEEPTRITALDLLEKLAMPDARIAHLAGGFDWGLPISNIPNYLSTVPRASYLEEIQGRLAPSDSATAPGRVVLTGRTGNGKTVIASDYCHIEAISYEFMCWIDCRDVSFIEPQVRNLISQLTRGEVEPEGPLGPVFAGILGRHRGPWLIVFDGIQDRADIEQYIPSMGFGSVVATTNNALNWWADALIIEVGELAEDEAVNCFTAFAGLTEDDATSAHGAVVAIVERLGRVPLAVAMSGIYFKNTEGDVDELAAGYFADLEALDDSESRPPAFPRTAFAAIQHAVRTLGKGERYGRDARAVLEIGALLAPELLPLNFMLLATAEEVHVDLANLPLPVEVDPVVRRGVLSALRTQSIASRFVNDGAGNQTPATETLAIHPLVHDILKRSYLAAVPPGQLESQCTVFMYFFVGWLGWMRDQGEYFALEQLRLHATSLVTLTDNLEPLTSVSPQSARVYAFAKALLQGELSTGAASRGRLQEAIDLGKAAAQRLEPYLSEKAARFIRMKILANMIGDFSMGEAPPEIIKVLAIPLIAAVDEAAKDKDASIREFAYGNAGATLNYLNRLELYRESTLLAEYRNKLADIAANATSGVAAINARVNDLYEAGEFAELQKLVAAARSVDDSLENAILHDALDIVCQLHTGAIEDALAGSDRLVAMSAHGNYLLLSLIEALKKVARELYRVQSQLPVDQPRIQPVLDRALARYYELVELAGGTAPPQA